MKKATKSKFSNNKPFFSLFVIVVSCQLVLVNSLFFAVPLTRAEDLSTQEPLLPEENINPENTEPIVLENSEPLLNLEENQEGTTTEPEATTTEEIILPTTENPLGETATTTDPATTTTEEIILNQENNGASPAAETALETTDNDPRSISLNMESQPLVGPRILAGWQMTTDKNLGLDYLGSDDNSEAGAQFLPSGQYAVNKNMALCALIVKGSGPAVLESVTANIYYPEGVAKRLDDLKNVKEGCGQKLQASLTLQPLSPIQAQKLLCQQIKNNNANLAQFSQGLELERLCAENSQLANGQAQIYCQETSLAYDDPAGNYQVQLLAKDSFDNQSPIFYNTFKYLELTAYSVDFDNINYGAVQQYTPKIITGNMTFETPRQANPATIRNVGNTRMSLIVEQNDFGLGKKDNNWNVNYRARIGDSDFINYTPNTPTALTKVIELGETNSLDFGIEVLDFPTETPVSYAGQMFLTAEKVVALSCPVTAP